MVDRMDDTNKKGTKRFRRRRKKPLKKTAAVSKVKKRFTSTLGPMTHKRWGFLGLGIIIILLLLSLIIHGLTTSSTNTPAGSDNGSAPITETVSLEQKALDKPMYILVVGINDKKEADAVYLLSVNKEDVGVDVIGIPSNSKIENRDHTASQPLSSIYASGGISLTKAVVEDMFHISIPYYIVMDEPAFEKIVNVTGDRPLYVEENMTHTDAASGQTDINLKQGYQSLDAEAALGYARYVDKDTNAFPRTQRQERLIKDMFSEFTGRTSLRKMFDIWRIWSHLDTNISTWSAMKLMASLHALTLSEIHYYIVPGSTEIDKAHAIIYWSIDPTGAQQLVGITMGMLDADTPMKANVNAQPAPVQTIDSQTAASDANDSAIKGVNDKQNGSSLAGGSQPSKKATEPGTPAE